MNKCGVCGKESAGKLCPHCGAPFEPILPEVLNDKGRLYLASFLAPPVFNCALDFLMKAHSAVGDGFSFSMAMAFVGWLGGIYLYCQTQPKIILVIAYIVLMGCLMFYIGFMGSVFMMLSHPRV